jgi:hypothetical protein
MAVLLKADGENSTPFPCSTRAEALGRKSRVAQSAYVRSVADRFDQQRGPAIQCRLTYAMADEPTACTVADTVKSRQEVGHDLWWSVKTR